MPTIIAVQSSLSLFESIYTSGRDEDDKEKGAAAVKKRLECQRIDLVRAAVRAVVGHFGSYIKFESVALISYSSNYEVLVPFTREAGAIEAGLLKLNWREGNSLEAGLRGAHATMKTAESSSGSTCRVVFITDGDIGPLSRQFRRSLVADCGEDRSKKLATSEGSSAPGSLAMNAMRRFSLGGDPSSTSTSASSSPKGQDFPLPFPFPFAVHFLALCSENSRSYLKSRVVFEKLVDWNLGSGSVHRVPVSSGTQGVTSGLQEICSTTLPVHKAVVKFGRLSERVTLYPAPEVEISNKILVVGFLKMSEVGSPPIVCRCLLYPMPPEKGKSGGSGAGVGPRRVKRARLGTGAGDGDHGEGEEADEGKIPSLCVVTHAALKASNFAALVKLGADRFGILYSAALDAKKKKFGLAMSIFHPGPQPVPWLPNLHHMAPLVEVKEALEIKDSPASPDGEAGEVEDEYEGFQEPEEEEEEEGDKSDVGKELLLPSISGVKHKMSYASGANYFVWTEDSGLEADVSKVIRGARKMPERIPYFYRELNRVRLAALGYGLEGLFVSLAAAFEREMANMGSQANAAHPEIALQLGHAASTLRGQDRQNPLLAAPVSPLATPFWLRHMNQRFKTHDT